MAELCNMIIPLKAVLKHLLKQNIRSQNHIFFTGTFYVIFLNGILQCFLQVISSDSHETKCHINYKSRYLCPFVFVHESCFLKPSGPWTFFATWHELVKRWRFWARGGRHFPVLTTEGSTPPHPIDDLCNDKNWNCLVQINNKVESHNLLKYFQVTHNVLFYPIKF